jgi:hypothetical protein
VFPLGTEQAAYSTEFLRQSVDMMLLVAKITAVHGLQVGERIPRVISNGGNGRPRASRCLYIKRRLVRYDAPRGQDHSRPRPSGGG